MKNFWLKFKWLSIGAFIAWVILPAVVYAVNVTIPQSTAKADLPVGKANGTYGLLNVGANGQCLIASSTSSSGLVWGACASGATGITTLNGLTNATQTFATGTETSGINLQVISSGSAHTFSTQLQSGYTIPTSTLINNLNVFYTTPSNRITAGTNLSWSGNTLNGTMASSTITAGGVSTFSPNITFATSTDTNLLLSIVCATSTCTFNPSWTGTLAAGRLNSNVVQSFTNDTNVTATISAQNATLGWTGQLAVSRGGTGTNTLGSLTVSSSNLSITGGQSVLVGTSTQITLTDNPTFTKGTFTNASTSNITISNILFTPGMANGCLQVASGVATSTGTNCGSGGSGNSAWTIGNGLIYNATSTDSVLMGTSTPTTAQVYIQGSGTKHPLIVASSSGATILQVLSTTTAPTLVINGSGSNRPIVIASSSGTSMFLIEPTGSTTIANLNASNCDVKSTTGGSLYCGTDATGGSGAVANGIPGFVTRYTGTSTITTGILLDNGTVAGANATSSAVSFNIQGTTTLDPFNISSSTGISVLRATVDQRIGIGTTSPIATLTVQGTSTYGSVNPFVIASSTGTQLVTVMPSGNVGIGTSSPSQSLAISSLSRPQFSISNPTANYTTTFDVDTAGDLIVRPGTDNSIYFVIDAANAISLLSNSKGLEIEDTFTTINSDDLFITGTGRTSIGTFSQSAKLLVQGSGSYDPFKVTSSTGTSLLVVTVNGNVGVGTTTPQGLLTLQGSSGSTNALFTVTSSTGATLLSVSSAGTTTLSSLYANCGALSTNSSSNILCNPKRTFINMLGANALPDTSGNVYFEPITITTSTAISAHGNFVFRDSGTKVCLSGTFLVPKDYGGSNATITPVWLANVASGAISWEVAYRSSARDNTVQGGQATAEQTASSTSAAPGAVLNIVSTEIGVTASNLTASDFGEYRLCRDGTQSADTLAATATLQSLLFEYDK